MSAEPTSGVAAERPPARFSLLDRWFRPVKVPLEVGRDLTDLARRGSIVFVVRSAGVLSFLYLAWLLRRHGLPPLRAALGLTGIMPWLARVRPSRGALEEAVARGESTVVFLEARGPDPFPLLVAQQRRLGRPVLLVPALLVWTRRPQKLKPTLGELLFGTPDVPSRLANAIGFALNHRRAVLQLGRASDLAAFVAERAGEQDAVLGRKIRGALHYHLAHQVRAVVGPPLKTAARMRGRVLRDKGLRASLERQAQDSGRPLSELEREAQRDLREIASRYSPVFIEVMRAILGWLFRRLYEAVDVDEEGLARVKRASADAPIVLCPSHKSHVDYLVLSYVFYENGMTPPHVAAGINLAFWPFGAIARWGGAFFIRRSLRGDRVYTATLRAYVKQLLRDRFPQEFYVEGGRSRSGKLLFPKTGLISMEVDAWLEQAADDVVFVPVAIDYEQLMEGKSYARELAGGEKRKEDLRGLLRARKVLRSRYGRLTIQFEEPVSLRAFAQQRLGERARSLTLEDEPREQASPGASGPDAAAQSKRHLVQALANRIAYGINRAITMTPVGLVSAALLAHTRRGLPAEEVARRVELLRYIAAGNAARFSRGFAGAPSDPLVPGPVADAVARLVAEGLVRVEQAAGETIYQVVEERRPLLDYYKNAVIHRYVPLAMIAVALRSCGGDAPRGQVQERARWLSRLLKLEFMYRVGATFDEIFAENTAFLVRLRALTAVPAPVPGEGHPVEETRESGGATVPGEGRVPGEALGDRTGDRLVAGPDTGVLEFLADLMRPYLESYRLMAQAVATGDRLDVDQKALVKAALEHGRAAYAAGRIALRESLSKATFENAAEWIAQQGAPSEDGRSRLGASWREKELPELIDTLDIVLTK